MRLWWNNLADSATAISASSYIATLPPSNVTDERRGKVWRTATSQADEYITFDLGSAKSLTTAIICGHNLTSGDSVIKLLGSDDNFSTSTEVAEFDYSASVMAVTFEAASFRYWRVAFTKSAAGQSRDIGRIFLGTYTDFDGFPDWDGLSIEPVDLSTKQRAVSGQVYSDVKADYREIDMDCSGISAAQATTIRAIREAVKTTGTLFVQPLVGGAGEDGEIFYVKFKSIPKIEADGMGADGNVAWATKFQLEEQL